MKLSSDDKSAIIDGILRFVAAGGFMTTALIAPNAVQVFDKPLQKLLDELDERSRERELRRIVHYMKQKELVHYNTQNYEHGMRITTAGKKRLAAHSYRNMKIPLPVKWDKRWRLILFDIPVGENSKRYSFTYKLRLLGLQQLQKSIWIHPFPCRAEIEAISETLAIRQYVTFIEISEIDGESRLRKRFRNILSQSSY